MRNALLATAAAVLLSAPVARAADVPVLSSLPTVSLGITAGTLGIGPQLGLHDAGSIWGVRGDATFLGFGHDFSTDGVSYHGHASLRSGGITADLYPFRTGFRLSLGGRINGNSVDVTATPGSSVNVGGRSYSTAAVGTLRGKADFNSVVPYFGVGYTHRLWGPIDIALDAGAIYQGSGRIDLGASGPVASNPIFQSGLASESARVHHYLHYAEFYPAVQLSLAYRF